MCHAFDISSSRQHDSTRAIAVLLSSCILFGVSCSRTYGPRTAGLSPNCDSAPSRQTESGSGAATAPNVASSPSSKAEPLNDEHHSVVDAERPAPKARVASFDCVSKKENKNGTSLRDWNGGGPSGAAWNIDGAPLACRITLDAPCTGNTELQVFGNKTSLGKAVFLVIQGTSKAAIEIPSRLWERAAESGNLNFGTLLLSVGGILVCHDDPTNIYPFADAFIAGFTGGE
jgi:hypothetical protein